MIPVSSWPPRPGDRLPRAGAAYAEPAKLAWILGEQGHGPEWARVLRIGSQDTGVFWRAIAAAVTDARIFKVTEPYGTVCGVEVLLIVGDRLANGRSFWHYEHMLDMPRRVTTYPRL